jgi:hypothetical protein
VGRVGVFLQFAVAVGNAWSASRLWPVSGVGVQGPPDPGAVAPDALDVDLGVAGWVTGGRGTGGRASSREHGSGSRNEDMFIDDISLHLQRARTCTLTGRGESPESARAVSAGSRPILNRRLSHFPGYKAGDNYGSFKRLPSGDAAPPACCHANRSFQPVVGWVGVDPFGSSRSKPPGVLSRPGGVPARRAVGPGRTGPDRAAASHRAGRRVWYRL